MEQSATYIAPRLGSGQEAFGSDVLGQIIAEYQCSSTPEYPRVKRDVRSNGHTWPTLAPSDYSASLTVQTPVGQPAHLLTGVWYGFAAGSLQMSELQTGATQTKMCGRWSYITDGLSNTILLVEQAGRPDYYIGGGVLHEENGLVYGPWAWPDSNRFALGGEEPPLQFVNASNSSSAFSFHPGGVHIALCDGSARFLPESISNDVFVALVSREGGEVVTAP
jgi:prepilin-type processing-associated H-X9-DG protein